MKSMHGIAVGKVNIVIIKKRSVQENIPAASMGKSKIRLVIFITLSSQFVIPQINLSPYIKNTHLCIFRKQSYENTRALVKVCSQTH